ncbi:Hypothetical_protein [Hexamita inflata]|uniref:Hypothetical_protein n=1 Tax=Hexamita inflata TaxID=28002 RepID=A0AA86Q8P4_9EUKA|nr:Hypothetical protein HINF_LOCUS35799 [Hexamita inflata]
MLLTYLQLKTENYQIRFGLRTAKNERQNTVSLRPHQSGLWRSLQTRYCYLDFSKIGNPVIKIIKADSMLQNYVYCPTLLKAVINKKISKTNSQPEKVNKNSDSFNSQTQTSLRKYQYHGMIYEMKME